MLRRRSADEGERGDDAEDAGALEGESVGAELGADDAGGLCGGACAELVSGEDPAEDEVGARAAEAHRR